MRRNLAGMGLFGDLPFMPSPDRADVWAHPTRFDLGAQVGVPPDAFSATGQQWGLPVYRWDVHEADDYRWMRERALCAIHGNAADLTRLLERRMSGDAQPDGFYASAVRSSKVSAARPFDCHDSSGPKNSAQTECTLA